MSETYKSYFQRNLKKVIAKFGTVALLDEIAESNLASALATKINGKAEQSVVSTLIGSDTDKSVRTIANEELAAQLIPASAQEALDTLQEIAAWIQSHPAEASAINAKLTLGTHEVGGEQVQYDTVKDYVEAYVAAQGAITLSSLSVDTPTGSGNVITGLTYDNQTGTFTPAKGITAIELDDLSVTPTGTGNVVTALTYDNTTGEFTATKGVTAITEDDLIDLTNAEVDALFVRD